MGTTSRDGRHQRHHEGISAMRKSSVDLVNAAVGTAPTVRTNEKPSASLEETRMTKLNHTIEMSEA